MRRVVVVAASVLIAAGADIAVSISEGKVLIIELCYTESNNYYDESVSEICGEVCGASAPSPRRNKGGVVLSSRTLLFNL